MSEIPDGVQPEKVSPPAAELKAAANRYLQRTPSGPFFSEETRQYCEGGISSATELFAVYFPQKFGEEAPDLVEKINTAVDSHQGATQGQLQKGGGEAIVFYIAGNRPPSIKVSTSSIASRLLHAAPELGRPEYLNEFGRLEPNESYSQRLEKAQAAFGTESPLLDILAVAYALKSAKDMAVTKTRNLLKRALNLENQPDLKADKYTQSIVADIQAVGTHEAYISAGRKSLQEYTEKAGLNEEQLQVLLDIAFLREDGFDENKDVFAKALNPLITAVAEGDWAAATKKRDLLLTYFGACFPDWRSRDYVKAHPEEVMTRSVWDLAHNWNIGLARSFRADIDTYPEIAADINRLVSVEYQERRKRILKESVTFSQGLSKRLGQEPNWENIEVYWDDTKQDLLYRRGTSGGYLFDSYFNTYVNYRNLHKTSQSLAQLIANNYYLYQQEARQGEGSNFSLEEYLTVLLSKSSETIILSSQQEEFIELAKGFAESAATEPPAGGSRRGNR